MEVETYQHINLDYLNLMTDGDNDMKKMMLDILFEEMPQEIALLTTHFEAENWEDLKSIAHKLKSTLMFVGNDQMTIANNQIEHNAMSVENISDIPDLINQVKEFRPLAMDELRAYYDKL